MDHVPCLEAWAATLGGISYPLLSDFWPHGRVARLYGVMDDEGGNSQRAIFLIDAQGIIRYIDIHDIGSQPSNDVLIAEIRRISPANDLPAEEEEAELPHGGIVMYCTPWCADCREARAWLLARGLPFTEVDISRSAKARAQVREWADGNETTPTFDIDGVIVVDFHPRRLSEVLNLS